MDKDTVLASGKTLDEITGGPETTTVLPPMSLEEYLDWVDKFAEEFKDGS